MVKDYIKVVNIFIIISIVGAVAVMLLVWQNESLNLANMVMVVASCHGLLGYSLLAYLPHYLEAFKVRRIYDMVR